MPHPVTEPFPFPDRYFQDPAHLHAAKSMQDYVKIFERRRNERPGGKFAPADIEELMLLAEDLDQVHKIEIGYIGKLVKDHPDYFRHAAQIKTLTDFADRHTVINQARKDDPFVDSLIGTAPIRFFRLPAGTDFLKTAQDLSAAIRSSEDYYAKHSTFDPARVVKVNEIAAQIEAFIPDLTLSDVDKPGRVARKAHLRNVLNLLRRPFGDVSHEAKWDDGQRTWKNWNRDITVYPKEYQLPKDRPALIDVVKKSNPLRMVAGGHAFNIASSMGGTKDKRIGVLVTLDEYKIQPDGPLPADPKGKWQIVGDGAAKYNLTQNQAKRVVRVSAGMRLRDFTKAMAEQGMALPVAGSTDAQSLGGLIATDLHSTGRKAGFLSQQILELLVLDSQGRPHTFIKDESVPRGTEGRWTWHRPGAAAPKALAWLPVSGALGTLGVVAEVVVKLDAALNFRKSQQFVPRQWAESNIHELLSESPSDELFNYDHVSFYYGGGDGPDLPTVRLNGWKRTADPVMEDGELLKSNQEILDHIGSAFLPSALLRLAKLTSPDPAIPDSPGDPILKKLNKRKALVLAAKDAFARKLFFQHDEIEVGIPLMKSGKVDYDIYRRALVDVQNLLLEQEVRTVIEVRFTPDASEAMLGPGTGAPTCYIELATPLGEYSRSRIVQVFHMFDHLLRDKYNARAHLGKKTAATFDDMAKTYGDLWTQFHEIRREIDPGDKFLPKENELLSRIFRKGG